MSGMVRDLTVGGEIEATMTIRICICILLVSVMSGCTRSTDRVPSSAEEVAAVASLNRIAHAIDALATEDDEEVVQRSIETIEAISSHLELRVVVASLFDARPSLQRQALEAPDSRTVRKYSVGQSLFYSLQRVIAQPSGRYIALIDEMATRETLIAWVATLKFDLAEIRRVYKQRIQPE